MAFLVPAFLCLTRAFAQASSADSLLCARLDSLVTHALPRGSQVAVCAYDLTADTMLYAYRPDDLARPASTMKLLTAITFLSLPQSDEPFRTELYQQGTVSGGVLTGDLYVVGGFDPEFDEAALDSLVSTLARQPYTTIRGHLYGDVSLKDSLYYGSGWLWDDAPESFQPRLSPLMLCKGAVSIEAAPATTGWRAEVKARPESSYYSIDNQTRSRTPSAGRYTVSRNWIEGGNSFVVSGNVDRRTQTTHSVESSADFFMQTLVDRLKAHGISMETSGISAETSVSKAYSFSEFRRDSLSRRLWVYETPVADVLDEMLKESDNLNAEAVLCRIGALSTGRRHLSASDGLKVVKQLIGQLGLNAKDYRLADGCGLSHYDYLSPRLLVAFLRYAYREERIRSRLLPALPVAGIDGTLKFRMPRPAPGFRRVQAKTGTYTGVCSLAGYLTTDDGHTVAFAIMNQNTLSARSARRLQDDICNLLIRPTYSLTPRR